MAARIVPLAGSARVTVIPNWPDACIRPVPRKENRLRAEWGLSDRFVIGYSGNLGRAHAPTAVAELVRRTSDIPNLVWLFIGGGAGREVVEAAAREAGAEVQFRPYQPRDVLDLSLSVPDLHLVSLDPACEGLIVPSKLAGVMAAGRGVIALGAPNGAVAREVLEGGLGAVLDIAVPDSWMEAVRSVVSFDCADRLGARSRQCYLKHHRGELALGAWVDALRDLVPGKAGARSVAAADA
jgi:glycosyltransferase involved in cell wall biosynthesis